MKLESEIECPSCKKKIKIKVEEMVRGRKKNCTWCRAEIKFTGDDGRKAQKAIDDFKKSLSKMFK
jgi:hypothetical protein